MLASTLGHLATPAASRAVTGGQHALHLAGVALRTLQVSPCEAAVSASKCGVEEERKRSTGSTSQ
eukprot:5423067-Alexandrium_andersonii.AAC.1